MRNISLTIEYDGTNYCGWQPQKQNNLKPSIHEIIESALRQILKEKIKLIGSGRTDSGVHARHQVANFKTGSNILAANLRKGLNSILPKDILIKKVSGAPLDFHSRFSAKSKTYRYVILNRAYHDPFLRNYAYFYPLALDIKAMRREARALLGRHNFAAFRASAGKGRNPLKTLKKIRITKAKELIYIDVAADGFLYNMARNIAGTLIDIGRGKLGKGSLKKILISRDRRKAGFTAPARGLFLMDVAY